MTSILLVRLSAMGDLVQSLGALAALHHVRPTWRLTFVTQSSFVPLLDGVAGVAKVVPFARRAGHQGLRRLRRELRRDRFDTAVDLQGNWKSAMVAWLSGAKRRIGIAGPSRQEPASRFLLHETIAIAHPPHPARVAWELVRSLASDAPFWWPRLWPTAAEVQREQVALAELGIDWQQPFRVIVRTDASDARALPPHRVAAETQLSAWPVLHLLGPEEASLLAIEGVPTLRHVAGEPRRLLALGHLLAAAGGDVIGPDQGASHVLAAAGAACRVLFGAQSAERTGPPSAVALVHPVPPTCSPCRRRRCEHPDGPVCMDFAADAGSRVALGLPPGEDRDLRDLPADLR